MRNSSFFKAALAVVCAAGLTAASISAPAADAPVKREMRSAWVATVWRLDWPQNTVSSTGNESQISRQKKDMTRLLDSMAVNNLNAVNFQVRSRCDAMYKSSYEPWSSDLVSERGLDPGWDPLAFVVEECHKRGLECHAWLNPYRFESVAHQWDNTPLNYRDSHPDWIMDVTTNGSTASILNPGKPEVTQRICDVIKEIVENYDVDGVLFDDYFYLSGTPASADADLYNAYKSNGGTLSLADWRRDNVNRMVAAVYKTIKTAKPWVRFGVSPAGIACTSSAVAKQYGITPCPTGSDWQYTSIYSDPVAWVSQQSLDFISPQIYWTIGHSTDYAKAASWWSMVANKWNRHFYSSHSISSLTASSKMPGMSDMEAMLGAAQPLASGPNSTTFAEYADEVRYNRESTLNDAPGSIFYSAKYLYASAPLFAHYLKTTVFGNPALLPAMTWHAGNNPGAIKNFTRDGNKLLWEGYDNVKYTVYAVPTSVPVENFDREAEYLLGTSYATEFVVEDRYLSGYNYAVCVLDRYGYEYSPVFLGRAMKDLATPVIVSPRNNEVAESPFDFTWNAVEGATSYIVEVARDAGMKDLIATRPVNGTTYLSDNLEMLPVGETIYWRVRACGNNYNDGVSAVEPFVVRNLIITSPANLATDVSLAPEITVSVADRDMTVEISENDEFDVKSIVFSAEGRGKVSVPRYLLGGNTTYYARALYTHNGLDRVSPVVSFTTAATEMVVPQIEYPVAGGNLHSDQSISIKRIDGPKSLRLEVCASTSFAGRVSYIAANLSKETWTDSKTASEIRLSGKALVDGETYYARVCAGYSTEDGVKNTSYSEPISFVYRAESAGVNDIATGGASLLDVITDEAGVVRVTAGSAMNGARLTLVNASGAEVALVAEGDVTAGQSFTLNCAPGFYLVRLTAADGVAATVKAIVK